MNLEDMLEIIRLIRIETMIEVSLFVKGEFIGRMDRKIAPSIGDEIIIDCGEYVKVIEVSHQWDDPSNIGVNCIKMKLKGGESET